ncbi:methyl-accepting chemotaxis protein [Brevibacillus fortis]|uniref:methyl-accepting chemotaxis protein n=1 Tax=Brevibacillus fortis TaxID=2126352 RepID=UPI001304FBBF|nr:methyl-accepting chemotaxis protein [Brevibacillus fortis]
MNVSLRSKIMCGFVAAALLIGVLGQFYYTKLVEINARYTATVSQGEGAVRQVEETVLQELSYIHVTSVVMFVLIIGLGWIISGQISRSIRVIADATETMAAGDLTGAEIQIATRDEVGQVAQAINQMARNLRNLIGQISTGADHVANASEELATNALQATENSRSVVLAMQELVDGAGEQMKGSDQIVDSMEHVEEAVKQMEEYSQHVFGSANSASAVAETGTEVIAKTVQQMADIAAAFTTTEKAVTQLDTRSREIEECVAIIKVMANQTNLLAINAAIEAARAGASGKGFAVVAGEVRKLADQSRQAAEQIADMLEQMRQDVARAVGSIEGGNTEVASGVTVVKEAGDAFAKIGLAVQQVALHINQVATGLDHTSGKTVTVTAQMGQLAQIAKTASERADQVAQAAYQQNSAVEAFRECIDSLSKLAHQQKSLIRRFKT